MARRQANGAFHDGRDALALYGVYNCIEVLALLRCLHHHADWRVQIGRHSIRGSHDIDFRPLTECPSLEAFDFRMAFFAHDDDAASLRGELSCCFLGACNVWACGVDNGKPARLDFCVHLGCDAVAADDDRALVDLIGRFGDMHAERLEIGHHSRIVDERTERVGLRVVLRSIDCQIERPLHAVASACVLCEYNFHAVVLPRFPRKV